MKKIVANNKQLQSVAKKIGRNLTKDLSREKKIPVVVGILKGSLNFMMDLVKNINLNVYTDYIQVSSYEGTNSTGKVKIKKDLSIDMKNRTLILVEDVIDTGISMKFLLDYLKKKHQPKRIILVALFDKKYRRKQEIKIDYVGITLKGDEFLYGYGLDYKELGRNLADVYALSKKEVLEIDKSLKTKN